jgi:hypothetical protein
MLVMRVFIILPRGAMAAMEGKLKCSISLLSYEQNLCVFLNYLSVYLFFKNLALVSARRIDDFLNKNTINQAGKNAVMVDSLLSSGRMLAYRNGRTRSISGSNHIDWPTTSPHIVLV